VRTRGETRKPWNIQMVNHKCPFVPFHIPIKRTEWERFWIDKLSTLCPFGHACVCKCAGGEDIKDVDSWTYFVSGDGRKFIGHHVEGNISWYMRYPDILPKDTLPKDTSPKDILPNGHFADGHFVERTILPNGHFDERTFRRKDILSNGQFAENRDVISLKC
jgi:hypothetical protein